MTPPRDDGERRVPDLRSSLTKAQDPHPTGEIAVVGLSANKTVRDCHTLPCSPSYPGNVIASAPAGRNVPTFVDILPTDVAVALHNVTLTVAN